MTLTEKLREQAIVALRAIVVILTNTVQGLTAQKKTPKIDTQPVQVPTITSVSPTIVKIPLPPPAFNEFPSMILKWADAIKLWEGGEPKYNNPGNIKVSPLSIAWGATPGRKAADGGYLAQFATYKQGHDALCKLLMLACQDKLQSYHKARTLGAFTKIYAGNPPNGYTNGIAEYLGVPLTTNIADFLL